MKKVEDYLELVAHQERQDDGSYAIFIRISEPKGGLTIDIPCTSFIAGINALRKAKDALQEAM